MQMKLLQLRNPASKHLENAAPNFVPQVDASNNFYNLNLLTNMVIIVGEDFQ